MDARSHLREIDDVAAEVLDLATRAGAKEKAGSRRTSYEKSLREVRTVAGDAEAAELADWIKSELRSREAFPAGREVRQKGAEICRRTGHSIPTGSWLGA